MDNNNLVATTYGGMILIAQSIVNILRKFKLVE